MTINCKNLLYNLPHINPLLRPLVITHGGCEINYLHMSAHLYVQFSTLDLLNAQMRRDLL
jgi:hypothetical protein